MHNDFSPEQWIEGYLNGDLPDEAFKHFEAWLRQDPANIDLFIGSLMHDTLLRSSLLGQRLEATFAYMGAAGAQFDEEIQSIDREVMEELVKLALADRKHREIEKAASTKLFADRQDQTTSQRADAESTAANAPRVIVIPRWLFVGGIAAAIAVACLLVLSPLTRPEDAGVKHLVNENVAEPVPVDGPPAPPAVAELKRAAGLVWADSAQPVRWGAPLAAGDYQLLQGAAELVMSDGTTLILTAPTSVRLETNRSVTLSRGTLVGHCPESARGFAVHTPTATIIDLGTEFGVAVDESGISESTVFTGRIITSRIDAATGEVSESVDLFANQTAVIDPASGKIAMKDSPSGSYVRDMTRTIDLLDVVAGGDGHGQARGAGVNPRNGQRENQFRKEPGHAYNVVDPKFQAADWSPFIDGVFIPGASLDQIDSSGSAMPGRYVTGQKSLGPIWVGDPSARSKPTDHQENWFGSIENLLRYSPSGRGVMGIHSNAGITFDLDAFKATNPGWGLRRFTATIANAAPKLGSNNIEVDRNAREYGMICDVFVIVDGRVAYAKRGLVSEAGLIEVDVPLKTDSRFLSVAVTDADRYYNFDWVLIGDPVLVMEPHDEDAARQDP